MLRCEWDLASSAKRHATIRKQLTSFNGIARGAD
jgi:hypothetical protein